MTNTDTSAMRPLLFPGDQQFWFETLRALGHTAYGGADIGEVITTAARISAGDYNSWYEQWAATQRLLCAGCSTGWMKPWPHPGPGHWRIRTQHEWLFCAIRLRRGASGLRARPGGILAGWWVSPCARHRPT